MKALPAAVVPYRRTPEFTEATIPMGLRRSHTTKAGVWGRIRVLQGSLVYRILEPHVKEFHLTAEREGVVEPQVRHEVEARGPVRFF